jgi:hypothetical protein
MGGSSTIGYREAEADDGEPRKRRIETKLGERDQIEKPRQTMESYGSGAYSQAGRWRPNRRTRLQVLPSPARHLYKIPSSTRMNLHYFYAPVWFPEQHGASFNTRAQQCVALPQLATEVDDRRGPTAAHETRLGDCDQSGKTAVSGPPLPSPAQDACIKYLPQIQVHVA